MNQTSLSGSVQGFKRIGVFTASLNTEFELKSTCTVPFENSKLISTMKKKNVCTRMCVCSSMCDNLCSHCG